MPLVIWGQWALLSQRAILDGILLFSISALLFIRHVLPEGAIVRPVAAQGAVLSAQMAGRMPHAGALLRLAAASAGLAWLFSGGNSFRTETLLVWVLAVTLYVAAFWERGPAGGPSVVVRARGLVLKGLRLTWPAVALLLVLAVAVFFRYYQIGSVPAEMTSDHAEKLLDVRDVLRGEHRIFFPRNTGREPLQFYLAVPFVQAVGLGFLALKLVTASVSLATVPLVYLIGREIADARYGLLAAFFLAVSRWDVAIGRVGLRFPLNPFFAALAFYFLLRALRRGRRNDYLLCGLATGIGLYGYSPFRAMLLLILLALLLRLGWGLREGRNAVLRVAGNGAVCFGAVLVVLIPLAHHMVEQPQMFWLRAVSRVAPGDAALPANPVGVLLGNLANGLLMFNWRGDAVWVNTVPGDPVLDFVSGGLFVLGVVWMLFGAIKEREAVASYLLLAFLVFMLPSVLSLSFPGENPSVVRAGANTFIAALLAAVPVYLVGKRILEAVPAVGLRVLVAGAATLLLAATAQVNYDRYFVDYANQYRQSARNSSEIAAVISSFASSVGSKEGSYIKSWPHWVDTRAVAFNIGAPDWNNVLMSAEDIARHSPGAGNKLYIMHKDDKDAAQRLQQRFPEGQLRTQPSAAPGQEFVVFFVPGRP
ncbi:MAG: ArnT family glycosyltransferase [Chloroflexota bacterium]